MIAARSYPKCPRTLSDEQKQQYWRNGYLAFDGVLDIGEVTRAKADLDQVLRALIAANRERPPQAVEGDTVYSGVELRREGSRCAAQLEAGAAFEPDDFDSVAGKVRKFVDLDDETPIFRSLRDDHERVHGVLRSLLPAPLALYQNMALVKPARIGSPKGWHQDNAYFSTQNLDQIIGVWIALEEATLENGCMFVVDGGHHLGPLKHQMGKDCELVPGRIDKSLARPVPLKPGGALFFHGNLPHFTPPNRSPRSRRALQFHFRSTSNAVISKDDYLKLFKEKDGTPATCHAATVL